MIATHLSATLPNKQKDNTAECGIIVTAVKNVEINRNPGGSYEEKR